MSVLIVIPARLGSTRLEGKVLLDIGGKPLIQHVWEKASLVKNADEVIVATDHDDVVSAVNGFGGQAVLTDPNHESGSDRVLEVAQSKSHDYVVNVQGDEPFLTPKHIEELIDELVKADAGAVTLCTAIEDKKAYSDPNVVKVVKNLEGNALYFSRASIPHDRDEASSSFFKHVGIYGFKKEILEQFSKWPQSELEKKEKLEQLRLLENGVNIKVVEVDHASIGIDTQSDLEEARKIYNEEN